MAKANRNDLNVNNLSFDGFFTANEDNDVSASNLVSVSPNLTATSNNILRTDSVSGLNLKSTSETDADCVRIRSQALVNSDNEESTDDERINIEQIAKFTIGDASSDHQTQICSNKSRSSEILQAVDEDSNRLSFRRDEFQRDTDEFAGNNRACGRRSLRHRQSFLYRSNAMQTAGDDESQQSLSSLTKIGSNSGCNELMIERIETGDSQQLNSMGPTNIVVAAANEFGKFCSNEPASRSVNSGPALFEGQNYANESASCANDNIDKSRIDSVVAAICPQFEKDRQQTMLNSQTVNQRVLIKVDKPFVSERKLSSEKNEDELGPEQASNMIVDNRPLLQVYNSTQAVRSQMEELALTPPAPPPSPISESNLNISRLNIEDEWTSESNNKTTHTRFGVERKNFSGSLSDNSHQRPDKREAFKERSQMEERLRNWKKSNKIITHIRENPFNMHIDCLERLTSQCKPIVDANNTAVKEPAVAVAAAAVTTTSTMTSAVCEPQAAQDQQDHIQFKYQENAEIIEQDQQLHERQNQHWQNYATHLSHLYKRNQTLMDNNNDFRTLLYNIICCLLIQDEQVLVTPSVTKMIGVIRTHLESTSKVYATAMQSINSSSVMSCSTSGHFIGQQLAPTFEDRRKSSLGNSSCASSNSSCGFNNAIKISMAVNQNIGANIDYQQRTQLTKLETMETSNSQQDKEFTSKLQVVCSSLASSSSVGSRRQVPADFRRVSSVSYNDEQLINDLCDDSQLFQSAGERATNRGDKNMTNSRIGQQESPWRFEELSAECKHHPGNNSINGAINQHRTSESSLENQSTVNLDLMNDSGIGTLCDYDNEFSNPKTSNGPWSNRKRHSDVCELKSKQLASYMSTSDDCFSQLPVDSAATTTARLYDDDDDENLVLQQHLHQQQQHQQQQQQQHQQQQPYQTSKRQLNEHQQPVDVASRRAELEWTLNKLINFELKYTWLTSRDTLRRAIRKVGVPNEIRGKVWLILIEQMIGDRYNATALLEEAAKTISEDELSSLLVDDETQSILKQIHLDVNRTMPGHKLFDDGAEGGVKLRRILVAYSIHVNRAIAYCQGFNFIVALLLSVFEGDEEKALRGFVCIVDHIFPSKFYFDHYLTGARADQFLLADFICDQLIKNPTSAERKMVEGVTSSITLNWFISLFHGAVPTLTRLTILDHFMLEGVKALFRFTMAILYLAFQVTPPSSCDIFTTIRNTAKDMYDIKLLLSIVEQIKLPKDSYFAIRRSFYMVQSSFNSDQFYMQSLSNDASRQLVSDKPLSVQQLPDTKAPAMSLITAASLVTHHSFGLSGDHQQNFNANNNSTSGGGACGPRVCTSSDRSKVCIQNIGKLGRSHLKIMDSNIRSNERSLMSPLRNCLVIGISNCGKIIVVARQSSKRNFKTFREQDLIFYVHELCTEIFDGFYLENCQLAIVLTHMGEIFKIDVSKCYADSQIGSTETLMLRDSHSIGEHEKVKLRIASIDVLTNLLWVYVECEDVSPVNTTSSASSSNHNEQKSVIDSQANIMLDIRNRYRANNPFLSDLNETNLPHGLESQQSQRCTYQRKILIIDVITFDVFSAFTVHQTFGDITKLRTSLVSFCQLANPMSNQFSSRIVRIGPTGKYEHLLSLSDVVDFMIDITDSFKRRHDEDLDANSSSNKRPTSASQRYSSIKRLLTRSISLNHNNDKRPEISASDKGATIAGAGALTKYYRSLLKSHSTAVDVSDDVTKEKEAAQLKGEPEIQQTNDAINSLNSTDFLGNFPKMLMENPCRAIMTSCLSDVEDAMETDYMPVNMTFIFRNGKIALFEFTESYAIHTRESQLDRYDYSKIIEVTKNGEDFIITILTIFDKLIKVVI